MAAACTALCVGGNGTRAGSRREVYVDTRRVSGGITSLRYTEYVEWLRLNSVASDVEVVVVRRVSRSGRGCPWGGGYLTRVGE